MSKLACDKICVYNQGRDHNIVIKQLLGLRGWWLICLGCRSAPRKPLLCISLRAGPPVKPVLARVFSRCGRQTRVPPRLAPKHVQAACVGIFHDQD